MSAVRQSYINRGVALFFILFTFADLLIPQFCKEELGGHPLPSTRSTGSNNTLDEQDSTLISEHATQEPSKNSQHVDEDCFCCCSHIVPGSHFSVAILELKSPETNPGVDSLPTSQPNAPFHPPRLS